VERHAVPPPRLVAGLEHEEIGIGLARGDRAPSLAQLDLPLLHLATGFLQHAAQQMDEPLFVVGGQPVHPVDHLEVGAEEDESRLDELADRQAEFLVDAGRAGQSKRNELLRHQVDDARHHERPREHVLLEHQLAVHRRVFDPRHPPGDRLARRLGLLVGFVERREPRDFRPALRGLALQLPVGSFLLGEREDQDQRERVHQASDYTREGSRY
jgi:hypothetical protein